MYADDVYSNLFETFNKYFYKEHPYGQTILGRIEHLKNPSLTKMYDYFQTYYVANNMALIISGDFNIGEIKPLISNHVIQGGMIPKVQSARRAISLGVKEVDITNGQSGIRILGGTRIVK